MNSKLYKLAEFIIIFLLIPISFAFSYPFWLKISIGVIGFLYVCFILFRIEKIKIKLSPRVRWFLFFKETIIKLGVIIPITVLYVYLIGPNLLFDLALNNTLSLLLILSLYAIFSAYPQEILFRTFFFNRYERYFKDSNYMILINAILFSLAHLLFKNFLVLLVTFIGGVLFALTYKKYRSTFLVAVEHIFYGGWVIIVGLGKLMGFSV
ncbi:CPBP family intramembrane glutamic endopeptidase [Aegicerativicinus sediminis]|uniref:CPBP family intramembrane glutamic endopeptidase n=1 Tax=Aegicerativicinus sediminis TaxID=2893202 RepID=UPI001E4E7669|nr:CPBP family intramembrane glutamic endopeptidase [Aegicerativicinus sediminis]